MSIDISCQMSDPNTLNITVTGVQAAAAPPPAPPPNPPPAPPPAPSPVPPPAPPPGKTGPYSVLDFGAKGDGLTDDAAAFQAAIDAAVQVSGTVEIPPPPYGFFYVIGKKLIIQPPSGQTQGIIQIRCAGPVVTLYYTGADGGLFQLSGVCLSHFYGINVLFAPTVAGAVCWDCLPTQQFPSMSHNLWEKCRVQFGTGGNNVAWRFGQSGGAPNYSDQSFFKFVQCDVQALNTPTANYHDIGWWLGGSEALVFTFDTCSAAEVDTRLLSGPLVVGGVVQSVPGQGVYPGGGDVTWSGGGASNCNNDFLLYGSGRYTIIGDRAENGSRYLQTGTGPHSATTNVEMIGVNLAAYTQPAHGACILLTGSDSVALRGMHAQSVDNSPFTPSFITVKGPQAAIIVDGGTIVADGPFYTSADPTNQVFIRGVQLQDATGAVKGFAANMP